MKQIKLRDFYKWKGLNKKTTFSLIDYLFLVCKQKGISSDMYFAFADLFSPSFVVHEGLVFLESSFSVERVRQLVSDRKSAEFWINLLTTDGFFEECEDRVERAICLANILKKSWESKLVQDFPDKKFIVECITDEAEGDYGLTFYQEEKPR
jgi:hypothetical protein